MTDCRGVGVLSLKTTLAFCSLIGTGMSIVKVDVRCYCNLPACVATGHMCRSSAGVCASERHISNIVDTWRHACLELLLENSEESKRRGLPGSHCQDNTTQRRCCTEDMCNYLGGQGKSSRNQSHVTGYLSNHDTSLLLLRNGGGGTAPDARRPLFFRFAIIAVPLAGCLVLALLVVMAARMLRVERQRQTRLKPADTQTVVVFHRRRSLALLPKSLSCVLPGSVQPGHVVRSCASTGSLWGASPSNHRPIYRSSASLSLSTDSGCTDTSREKYFVFDV